MTDESALVNLSTSLRIFSALSEKNQKHLCQHTPSLGLVVNLLLHGNYTIVENALAILKNISKYFAVDETLRLVLRQNNYYEKLLSLLQSLRSWKLVNDVCEIIWILSVTCADDRKILTDLGAVALLSQFVTSEHETLSMVSSAAIQNLLTSHRNGFNDFKSELESKQIHYTDHNQVLYCEGSPDEVIDFSSRCKEFQSFMPMSPPEFPRHYCVEDTPDNHSLNQDPIPNFDLKQIVGGQNTAKLFIDTETVPSTVDQEDVPVDYGTRHLTESFSIGSSVSSLSKLSLRSLERPGMCSQLLNSKLKEGLGSHFEFARLLCNDTNSSSLLQTPTTSTPHKPSIHPENNFPSPSTGLNEDKTKFNDSFKDISSPSSAAASSSSSSFSCSSDESGIADSSVSHCLELAMPKPKDSQILSCPSRKSCDGSDLNQTTDQITPSKLEKFCFSEDEGNITVIHNVNMEKEVCPQLENKTMNTEPQPISSDNILDSIAEFYEKTCNKEVENSRFLVNEPTCYKEAEHNRFVEPTGKKSSKIKLSKPFNISIRRKKKNLQNDFCMERSRDISFHFVEVQCYVAHWTPAIGVRKPESLLTSLFSFKVYSVTSQMPIKCRAKCAVCPTVQIKIRAFY